MAQHIDKRLGVLRGVHGESTHAPTLSAIQPDATRVAVLLNRNARLVNDRLVERIARIVGSDHVYYSQNIQEAEAFTREIVQRGYGTILSGGGDGTLCRTINLIRRYIDESNAWRKERQDRYNESQTLLGMPRFGFLKLGTGNGMTHVIGAGNPIDDLKMIIDYAPGRTHQIPLIETEGQRFFFGGMGYDSIILNDYNTLKNSVHNRFLKFWAEGLSGYFAAFLSRTLPHALFGNTKIEGRVVTHAKAYFIDPRRGDAAIPIEPGSTLYEGAASFIAAGTSPFFGYGLRIFPFSNIMPGMMHLRISTLGPLGLLANIKKLWRGHYRNPGQLFDFLVSDISIEVDRPFPFQHSGDPQGMRSHVAMRVADEPLRLVDCYSPRRHH